MSYDDACEVMVSREQARREIAKHGQGAEGFAEFLADVGDKPEYEGREVLDWLGY